MYLNTYLGAQIVESVPLNMGRHIESEKLSQILKRKNIYKHGIIVY